LVNALKLPPDLVKYDLTGAGCVGAMPMMSLADDYLKAHPDKRVLAIVAEVPSAGLGVRNPHDKGEIVVNALFGDGAVGLVLGAAGADPGFPEVVDLHYLQQYDTLDVVYAVAEAGGVLGAHVERGMADHAATIFGPAVDELLERHRLSRDDIRHWVFHPGGPAILERLQAEFSLTDAQLAPTWDTLKHCGNASGPTCLIALNRLIHEQPPQRGDWGILGAIGPGLTVGVALLQW
jgi:alkylresorcinol/alkylpyrone synthase